MAACLIRWIESRALVGKSICAFRHNPWTAFRSVIRLSTTRVKLNKHGSTNLSTLKEHLRSIGPNPGEQKIKGDSKLISIVETTSKEIHLYTIQELVLLVQCLEKVKIPSPVVLKSVLHSIIQRSSQLTLEDAYTVTRVYRNLGLQTEADSLSYLFSQRLLKALTKGDYIHPRVVITLSERRESWSKEFVTAIQNYALTHTEQFSIRLLTNLLTLMVKKNSTSYTVRHKCADMAKTLMDSLPKSMYDEVANLFWVYGKCSHYHAGLFDSLEKLTQVEDKYLSPYCITTLAWSCARVRYYNPNLMEFIAHYSLANLDTFKFHDMSSLVYAYGSLNHPHKELFAAVAERIVGAKGTRNIEQAHWVFVWACLVLEVYDTRVLSKVLTTDFIEASARIPGYKITQPLQISIALNYKRPDLGFGAPNPQPSLKWGVCFPSVQGVDDKHIQQAVVHKLDTYQTRDRSRTFVDNVNRALCQILGGPQFVNREVISLSGYVIDFEVILNERNEPILIPREWMAREKDVALKSIGVTTTNERTTKPMNFATSLLIEETKQSEGLSDSETSNQFFTSMIRDNTNGRNTSVHERSNSRSVSLVNLASDWGAKFRSPGEKIGRRLAIEADGLPHFASNCDHVLGPTVLKHRQLRALGWDVVQIPFIEWRSLSTGDDHAQYLREKVFGRD